MNTINIAAAIITDNYGRCLLVRKRGTQYFMQPGGKPEAEERPEVTLMRELKEELNFNTSLEQMISVGRFTDVAANEPGYMVCADIFSISTDEIEFTPNSEIEEVIWYDPGKNQHINLAPLTENYILPLLMEK